MKYPVLLESICCPGLVVYMTSNCCGVVVKEYKTFALGNFVNNWSTSEGEAGKYNWKEYNGDITIIFRGKPPLKEWLMTKMMKNRFRANNEYPIGLGEDFYFKVMDFTFEDKGYSLYCEDYEIKNVTKEQIISFAKSFGLELSDD